MNNAKKKIKKSMTTKNAKNDITPKVEMVWSRSSTYLTLKCKGSRWALVGRLQIFEH